MVLETVACPAVHWEGEGILDRSSTTSSLEAEGQAMKPFLSTAGGNAGREPAEVIQVERSGVHV